MSIENFSLNLFLNDNKNEIILEIDNKNSNINLKYEIYGNKNLYSDGIIKCNNCIIPRLNFKIKDNTVFFFKVKIFNQLNSKTNFKFFNINELCPDENLNMSIEDISKKMLFESINLSNDDNIDKNLYDENNLSSDNNSDNSNSDAESITNDHI